MRRLGLGLIVLLFSGFVATAQERTLIPERRTILTEGFDLLGRDIRQIFDTTFEACEAACLTDSACIAFTFNARSNSCFPKSEVTGETPYQGAWSGRIAEAPAGAAARVALRAAETAFLQPYDFDAALSQARGLGAAHATGGLSADELLAAAASARAAGDTASAAGFQGAAVNLTDAPDQWAEYARLLLELPAPDDAARLGLAGRALSASINAYLRADGAPVRAAALFEMARALEAAGRGRDMIPALRLAQGTAPRDEAAALLDDAIGKYGFRIEQTQVTSDNAAPRICATFTEELARSGTDYATFVRLPETGLSVEASGRQICVAGVTHGQRYALTFREGLPAASGETLAKDIAVNLYVRDRTPAVRFPGRAYILPRLAGAGIPVETVNTDRIGLSLRRISDRNLVRAIRDDLFARPLDYWTAQYFDDTMTEAVWQGSADVGMEVNRDITTRLPMDEALKGAGPGIYILSASVPGRDPYDNPAAMQWFVVSDLGITSLSGADGVHVIVRSLADAGAKAGATVALVSRANSVIATTATDDQGYARFDEGLAGGTGGAAPALVTVADGDDFAFLSLTDPEFDLTDRGVAGREAAPPIDLFLTTDRGAYRAGETVNATLLARDGNGEALSGLPLTVRLIRPDGVEHARALSTEAGAGGHIVSMPIGGTSPRGAWRIEAFAEEDRLLASQTFLVEDFLPERIDFALDMAEGVLSLTDRPEIGISARYLFGAPGGGLAIEGDWRLFAAASLDAFPGYRFGRHDEGFASWGDAIYEAGATDDDGNAALSFAFPDLGAQAARPLQAQINVRLREGSGRPVERRLSRIVLPEEPVFGIRPAFDGDSVAEGTEAAFAMIAVGPDGNATTARARWTINRIETSYQWYALYGQWNWEVTTTRTRVAGGEADLSAAAPVTVSAPVEWGTYEIVVEAADGGNAVSSMEFHAGWYAPADAARTPDTLELSLDKAGYRPGETAMVRVVARAAGIALVTVLTNRVIDMKTVPVSEGENLIPVSVTDDWGPGAYVTASVIRPLDGAEGRTSARALGLAYAPVDPGSRRLSARFEAPAEADPRSPLPIALKVDGLAPGDRAWATIAAVDLGILNLTGFTPPDPDGHYFGQRRLGVGIRDVYGRLIDGQTGALGAVRSGGDGGAGLRMKAPPPTEELVAWFSGPVEVGADGYARTGFDLPAFNGTVRLMAVVWSDRGIGQASSDVLVRDPVVVTASVPRFLAPGDSSRMLLEIVHASGPAGRMGIDVSGTGVSLGAAPSGIDLAEKGKATLSVPLTAPGAEDDAAIRIALTTPDGRQLLKTLALPVRANDPEVARQSRFTLAAGESVTLDGNVFAGLVPGTGRATLAVGPVARFDAPGILSALDRYPYGCTEQITSKALPLLYLSDVAEAAGIAADTQIATRIDEAIAEVLLNQASNGSFGLWSPESGDFWLDAYVTDFLSRARAAGHAVPDLAFRNALDNLRNQVNYAPDFDTGGGPIAYALMVLAREGAAAVGDLRYYADVKGDAFDTPIAAAQLGAALAAYGDQTRADAMFARAARLIALTAPAEEARVIRADYGTNLRDATALLALAAEAGSTAFDAEGLSAAVASGLAGRRLSTQEAMWALLATHALIDRPGAEGFTVNGAPAEGALIRAITDEDAPAQVIANGSGREATVTLTTYGIPTEPEPAGGNGYAITRTWYTMEGEPADPAAIRQGDRLVTVIEVTPFAVGEARLIIDDPLPAGFEIDNPALVRGGDIAALDWLVTTEGTRMTEFRQDRFLAAVDRFGPDPIRLAYIVRAISPGDFHLPAAAVEDMYRPGDRARTETGRIRIAE